MTMWVPILAALLVAASLWILVRPTWLPAAADSSERIHQLRLVRDRLLAQLNELEVETADRSMAGDTAVEERARVEAELAAVLRELEQAGPAAAGGTHPSQRAGVTAVAILALFLILATGGLYLINRTPAPAEAAGGTPAMIQAMVGRLEARLQQNPEDPAGWARLGRSYAVLGRLDGAYAAYARAYKLAPRNPGILADYAWLLYSQDPSNTRGLVGRLYRELQQLQPNHPRVLWFLGYEAYQQKKFARAIQYWERLVQQLEPGSDEAQHLGRAISNARDRLRQK